jgi:hypothetical protein
MEIKLKKNNTPKEEGLYLCKHPLHSIPEMVEIRLETPFMHLVGELKLFSHTSCYPLKDTRGKKLLWSDKIELKGLSLT